MGNESSEFVQIAHMKHMVGDLFPQRGTVHNLSPWEGGMGTGCYPW